jgi:hypothetical protein
LVAFSAVYSVLKEDQGIYLEKIRVFKAGLRQNTLAWNKRIGRAVLFGWLAVTAVMMNRGSWGHLYLIVRGEILGLIKDKLLRKHLPRMLSLIKNEGLGIENDQIPL